MHPTFQKIWHGAAYYPELWPQTVDEDLQMMQETGINLVRIGEFAWSTMEPEEGRYTLGWLHDVLDKCHAASIGVMLCTPTPTPPRWLTEQYPEVLRVDADGLPFQHGSRQHVSHTSPIYRDFSRRITEKLASEFGAHPALVAWQTDNEFLCHVDGDYGPSAVAAWHDWLQRKYGSIDALNEAWQTRIWSEDYPAFTSIPTCGKTPFGNATGTATGQHHSSLAKDWGLFISESTADFQREQVEIIRRYSSAPITHNQIAHTRLYDEDAFADLDFAGTDFYMTQEYTWAGYPILDMMRGSKMQPDGSTTPYMLLETSPSHPGNTAVRNPSHANGYLPVEAFCDLALGGNGFCYWLWRQQQSGAEMCHGSIITAWGMPSVGWENVRAVSDLLARIGPLLLETPPAPAEIAIHDSRLSKAHFTRAERLWHAFKPYDSPTEEIYRPLLEKGFWRDIRFETADISRYRVVLSPFMPVLTDELIDRMVAFMENGGTWVVGPMSGCRTVHGTVPATAGLGRLDALAGVKTLWPVGFDRCRASFADEDEEIAVGWYCFGLVPVTNETIVHGEYLDGPAEGSVWCVEHPVGKGRIILLAAHPLDGGYGHVIEHLLADMAIPRYLASWGTTIVPRAGENGRAYLIANWDGNGGTAELPEGGFDLLTGRETPAGKLHVAPYGMHAVRVE